MTLELLAAVGIAITVTQSTSRPFTWLQSIGKPFNCALCFGWYAGWLVGLAAFQWHGMDWLGALLLAPATSVLSHLAAIAGGLGSAAWQRLNERS